MAYNDEGGAGGGFQRQMYKGNWKCSKCGGEINELPFEPSPERMDQLMCRNCFREKRQSFGGPRQFGR